MAFANFFVKKCPKIGMAVNVLLLWYKHMLNSVVFGKFHTKTDSVTHTILSLQRGTSVIKSSLLKRKRRRRDEQEACSQIVDPPLFMGPPRPASFNLQTVEAQWFPPGVQVVKIPLLLFTISSFLRLCHPLPIKIWCHRRRKRVQIKISLKSGEAREVAQ